MGFENGLKQVTTSNKRSYLLKGLVWCNMNCRHSRCNGSSIVQYCSHPVINVAWKWRGITTFVWAWCITWHRSYSYPNWIGIVGVFIRSLHYEAGNAWSRSKGPSYLGSLRFTMCSQRRETIKCFVYIFHRGFFFGCWRSSDRKKYQSTNGEKSNCFHKYDFVNIKLWNQITI